MGTILHDVLVVDDILVVAYSAQGGSYHTLPPRRCTKQFPAKIAHVSGVFAGSVPMAQFLVQIEARTGKSDTPFFLRNQS